MSTAPITPQAADEAIRQHLPAAPAESRPLAQCVGRILRQDVHAERDNPPFDRVCMDGIAIASGMLHRGSRRFQIKAVQQAGEAPLTLEAGDSAIEVMTGAMLPHAADMVIPLERYTVDGGIVTLDDDVGVKEFHNIQRRGVDGPSGSLMLHAGTVLGPAEIAVAASAGLARLQVAAQPAVMVISTGNELIEPGEPIAEHQVRRSNVYAMLATLRARAFERVGSDHLPDDAAVMHERLGRHLHTYDVLILSGGVSMGKFDLVPNALKQLGVREIFHKVAQRPGKPLWFGIGPAGQAVFGLPGNPVSTLICLLRFVVPSLTAAAGALPLPNETVTLSAPVTFEPPLTLFLPIFAEPDPWGHLWGRPQPTNSSGDYISLIGTDGFIQLPPGPVTSPKGFGATLYRW